MMMSLSSGSFAKSSARRTSTELTTSADRRKMRKEELRKTEREQREEDKLALKMTEEQCQILHRSFDSVKTEFSDLDGLSWAKSAFCGLQAAKDEPHLQVFQVLPPLHCREINAAVLSDADFASFSPDDTIRVSRYTPRSRSPASPIDMLFVTPQPVLQSNLS